MVNPTPKILGACVVVCVLVRNHQIWGRPQPAAIICSHSSSSKITIKMIWLYYDGAYSPCSVFLANIEVCWRWKCFIHAVANEGVNRLGPRRHYSVFIWICLMFYPLVIWALFHVRHQKDIKQDAGFKFRSQSKKKKNVMCVLTTCNVSCVFLCAVGMCFRELS